MNGNSLKALSVDDSGAKIAVLFLGDTHLLESGQRGHDRATDPGQVLWDMQLS